MTGKPAPKVDELDLYGQVLHIVLNTTGTGVHHAYEVLIVESQTIIRRLNISLPIYQIVGVRCRLCLVYIRGVSGTGSTQFTNPKTPTKHPGYSYEEDFNVTLEITGFTLTWRLPTTGRTGQFYQLRYFVHSNPGHLQVITLAPGSGSQMVNYPIPCSIYTFKLFSHPSGDEETLLKTIRILSEPEGAFCDRIT
ncbi:hypothetical protein EG68_11131 [Paragonimus skrjabini miyazakii]|uniref:Uncharacterized protein n=1 Tax=Paragonimus skrjabini miyazakii TaxID=59628 RepID=A0A8S9YF26_9TREM|nr:hypothetical protein EG68_11131 [Paragonimus skrjabini miyazakii]